MLMLVGIVSWSAFAETLGRGTNILVDNANLIGKLTFPTEILPAYVTVSALVNMLIALPIVLGALVWAMFFPQDDPVLVARMAEAGNPGIVLGAAVLWLPLLLLLDPPASDGGGVAAVVAGLEDALPDAVDASEDGVRLDRSRAWRGAAHRRVAPVAAPSVLCLHPGRRAGRARALEHHGHLCVPGTSA